MLRDPDVVRSVLEFIGRPRSLVTLEDAIAGALVERGRSAPSGVPAS